MSSQRNRINPASRLTVEAGVIARCAVEVTGRGCWKKQRPLCNGADRKRQLLCDKQADFQLVMKDEKAGRTIA
jgi:hypothetical protein